MCNINKSHGKLSLVEGDVLGFTGMLLVLLRCWQHCGRFNYMINIEKIHEVSYS